MLQFHALGQGWCLSTSFMAHFVSTVFHHHAKEAGACHNSLLPHSP